MRSKLTTENKTKLSSHDFARIDEMYEKVEADAAIKPQNIKLMFWLSRKNRAMSPTNLIFLVHILGERWGIEFLFIYSHLFIIENLDSFETLEGDWRLRDEFEYE